MENKQCKALPNEVIQFLLNFLEAEDILPLRTVSRAWNEMVCYQVKSQKAPVKFFKVGYGNNEEDLNLNIVNFMLTMENKQGPHPFSAFEFFFCDDYPKSEAAIFNLKKFANKFGHLAKSYSFHLSHFIELDFKTLFETLLNNAHALERLYVYGQDSWAKTTFTLESAHLHPKLQILSVMPYSPHVSWIYTDSDHVGPAKVSFDQFLTWETQAPNNEILQVGFGVLTKSEGDAKQYLTYLKKFKSLELELTTINYNDEKEDMFVLQEICKSPPTNLHSLYLNMPNEVDAVYNCLGSVSSTLKKLNLTLHGGNNRIPPLHNLDILELVFAEDDDYEEEIEAALIHKLDSNYFPVLKSLSIENNACSKENWKIFEGSIFQTVESLKVEGYKSNKNIPWEKIFPNSKQNKNYQFEYQNYTKSWAMMRQLRSGAVGTDTRGIVVLKEKFVIG